MRSSILVLVVLLSFLATSIDAAPRQFSCMSYMEDDKYAQDDDEDYGVDNQNSIENPNSVEPTTIANDLAYLPHRRICQPDYTFCFSLWRQTANGTHIEKQGCWKESTERNATCSQSECNSSAPTTRNSSLYYCCCSGDICNQHVAVVEPAPMELAKNIRSEASELAESKQRKTIWTTILLWCTGLATTIIIAVFLAFYYCPSYKEKPEPEQSPLAPSGPGYSSNLRNVDNMNLIGMLGSGKYGTVMKGLLNEQEVAVKIFPEAHHQYYINERNIYSLPLMDCPALLTYFGYDERHTMEGSKEYQIVLSLAPFGCLQDWLIANTLDFEKCCGMLKTITRGISHLHTELRIGDEHKPCIAHRDLNSRNVLVKADLTCCIADFGFALKVFGSKYEYKGEVAMAETKSINEVGTLRYMAPELLEGAVNLRDCETSLKQMDVYALGLVLWEVSTRCVDFYAPGQPTPPYKAPYELEVGPHPSFDQMQALVVRHKARPLFPASWCGSAAAKLIKDTCEDCWDHDAEARLTSLCAEERMQEMSGLRPRLHAQPTSPLLNTNNLTGELTTNAVSQVEQVQVLQTSTGATTSSNAETSSMLQPPPNQQIPTEKNHMSYVQQQLQPYQGRNPCQERNLAPLPVRTPQVLVEKSKKHSFQTPQEHSFSCLEDDVSVEELIAGGSSKNASNLGQGFPKQQNTDHKLSGWHGVRALIHKKLFRKEDAEVGAVGGCSNNTNAIRSLSYGDEKCNLMDNRYAAVLKGLDNNSLATSSGAASRQCNFVAENMQQSEQRINGYIPAAAAATTTTTATMNMHSAKRPNNLDISPMSAMACPSLNAQTHKSNLPEYAQIKRHPQLQSTEQRSATPAHIVPRSLSTSLIKHINQSNQSSCGTGSSSGNGSSNYNNNNHIYISHDNELKTLPSKPRNNGHQRTNSMMASMSSNNAQQTEAAALQQQIRRQHSLEVFREVFSGRGSNERLRDPSQRVKTPGDVPPSVRKVRASKTLSLYDDRMMESSMLNIL